MPKFLTFWQLAIKGINVTKKPIPEFPDFTVSDTGEFVNTNTGRTLTLSEGTAGSLKVNFKVNGKTYTRSAAKIVCTVFNGSPPENKNVYGVWYKDFDYTNLHYLNLEWRPTWFIREYHEQLKRGGVAMRSTPIRRNETGEVFADSLAAALAYRTIEKYIILAAQQGDVIFAGSTWSFVR